MNTARYQALYDQQAQRWEVVDWGVNYSTSDVFTVVNSDLSESQARACAELRNEAFNRDYDSSY